MNSMRTLWMGNIENWMDEKFISKIFKSLNATPNKVNIRNSNVETKRGCAFIEFESQDAAQGILSKYNNTTVEGVTLKLNWVNNSKSLNQSKKYTIYVGGLNHKVSSDDLKNFFKKSYSSIINAKVITSNSQKNFGFVDFTNYKEYSDILLNKNKFSLNGSKLIINSAKIKKEEERKTNYQNYQTVSTGMEYFYYYPVNNYSSMLSVSKYEDPISTTDDFASAVQKGFRDVLALYRSSTVKPQISFQCNYYCNINEPNTKEKENYIEMFGRKIKNELGFVN